MIQKWRKFVHKMAAMTDNDLNRMLKQASTAGAVTPPVAFEHEIMARVRTDDGRAKRWRSLVRWVLVIAAVSAVLTAGVIGWSLALRDKTHTTPPTMTLFREGLPQ